MASMEYQTDTATKIQYPSLQQTTTYTEPTKSGNEYSGPMNLPSQQPDSVTDPGLYESRMRSTMLIA